MFFKLIKLHLLVSELNIYQKAGCNKKKSETDFMKIKNIYNSFVI